IVTHLITFFRSMQSFFYNKHHDNGETCEQSPWINKPQYSQYQQNRKNNEQFECAQKNHLGLGLFSSNKSCYAPGNSAQVAYPNQPPYSHAENKTPSCKKNRNKAERRKYDQGLFRNSLYYSRHCLICPPFLQLLAVP